MHQLWVDASHLKPRATGGDPWDVDFSAHPLLDPAFTQHPTRVGRFFRDLWRRIRDDDTAYRRELHRMLNPAGTDEAAGRGPDHVVRYLTEADAYVRELVELLPAECRAHVAPHPNISACNDLRTLLQFLFEPGDSRLRYEAQRKLYLAKLLMDIDHSRDIQNGPRHRAWFERRLREGLWEYASDTAHVEFGFDVADDGQTIHYNVGPRPGQERWVFKSVFVQKEVDGRRIDLDVLYYNCRFKRTVTPVSYEIVDGSHRVVERKRWQASGGRRSSSVLSKMIRRGINDPDRISDLLGAMFIVNDEESVTELLVLLDSIFGNPIAWRNITDTLADGSGGLPLNAQSGAGYKVYKGDLDILHPAEEAGGLPYRFQVEIQIYTLEGFLRTVHGDHDASHLALKLRQFLHGLVPVVFPRDVYGTEWLSLGNGHTVSAPRTLPTSGL